MLGQILIVQSEEVLMTCGLGRETGIAWAVVDVINGDLIDGDVNPAYVNCSPVGMYIRIGSIERACDTTEATNTREDWKETSGCEDASVYLFRILMNQIHHNARDKGFWDDPTQADMNPALRYKPEVHNKAEKIALIHSELSEALEALRKGNPDDEHCPKFSSVEIELADAVIRIMDMCEAYGYRLPEAMLAKMDYNADRPAKHGKAF